MREGRSRILVGADAAVLDERVRADPERAYDAEFYEEMVGAGGMNLGL